MKKHKFKNNYLQNDARSLYHFLLWQCGLYKDDYSATPQPPDFIYPNDCNPINATSPKASWINHSTFSFELLNYRFLTDPIWNVRCSPSKIIGPKRRLIPPFHIDELEPPHFLLISHNHYDHLDYATLKEIFKRSSPTILTTLKIKNWFEKRFPEQAKKVIELGWWESWSFEDPAQELKITFTSVPAQHFSGRGIWDRNEMLWCGFVVEFFIKGSIYKRCYFAGDTGYNQFDFREIGKRFAPIDLSLIPIGCYSPKKFMDPVHINPQESIAIHLDVHSKLSIGGHWGTFKLSDESIDRPPYDLYLSMHKVGLPLDHFRVLKPGQWINW